MTRTLQSDLDEENALLNPMLSSLDRVAISKGIKFDFLELTSWMFVGGYWSILADLGQVKLTQTPSVKFSRRLRLIPNRA